jgi:hypothetical protein
MTGEKTPQKVRQVLDAHRRTIVIAILGAPDRISANANWDASGKSGRRDSVDSGADFFQFPLS